jgi:pimeloyl-ACP methyl ester carboxylesterase
MIFAVSVVCCGALAWLLWTPDRDQALLESRYLASPDDMKQIGDWRLHVRDSGPRDAPAVILIHGFGSSLQTWDAWVQGLSRTLRVIRLDLPGSGLSPPDPAADYTDARTIQLLLTLMDNLSLQRASIVGHSIGGRVAWTFAAKHPERTDRLVLVAPDGLASPGFDYGKAPNVPALLGLMRYVMPRPLLRMNLAPAYADSNFLTDALVERYDDLLRAPGARQAVLDRMRQTVLVDPQTLLPSIRAPTLLVWGERDAMIPIANAADYTKALVDARLVVIPSSGHLPQEEAASESLAAVEGFLSPKEQQSN